MRSTGILLFLLLSFPCIAGEPAPMNTQIDQRSYTLGGFATFAEMVRVGVKSLALSAPLAPAEMDGLLEDAGRIAREERVLLYRETDLIVTDLFPADVAKGKHVLLIYQGGTLDAYLALKQSKSELVAAGSYTGAARTDIARQFGRLLSYPEAVIEELINDNAGPVR